MVTPKNATVKRATYWYFITDYYCPACGKSESFYEKRTDERPREWNERHELIESYDYCG